MKLTKEGNIPDFSHKNSGYWIKHDLKHIKESIIKTLKFIPVIIVLSIIFLKISGYKISFTDPEILRLILLTTLIMGFIILILLVIFTKGYSIWSANSSNRLTHKGPYYPYNSDKLNKYTKKDSTKI